MSTFTPSITTTATRHPRRARTMRFGLVVVRLLLAAQFAVAGVLKLTGESTMVAMFDDIGAGQWLRLFVGSCELAGAIGLFVPRLQRLAATGLVGLMVGAAVTNVVALHINPALPLALLVLAALVAVVGSRQGGAR